MLVAASATTFIALALCAPPLHPLIAEVCYDAIGDDTGYEFVELFNPSPLPFPLAGARLEAGDGAGADRWTVRWTGASTDTIGAGARFVIGGIHVRPPANSLVQLDLQNGPDAVRMTWPDGTSEVVGYGALVWPEYLCGAPAPDVPSGLSLARTPDDADHGSNAADFVAATPLPGRTQPARARRGAATGIAHARPRAARARSSRHALGRGRQPRRRPDRRARTGAPGGRGGRGRHAAARLGVAGAGDRRR